MSDLLTLKEFNAKKELPLFAEVDLDEMQFDEQTGIYSTACRCSGKFEITEADLEKGIDTIQCGTCTLIIKVQYQLAD